MSAPRPSLTDETDETDASDTLDTPDTLDRTLVKNEAVAVEVQGASDHLSLVATVLEHELPASVQVGEVAQAIAHAGQLEKQLARSAQALVEVNQALAEEIEKRNG